MTDADISVAKRLTGEGFTVLLPLLFGRPGDNRAFHNLLAECGRSKFDCYGSGRLSKRFAGRFFRLDLAGSHKHSSLGGNFSCIAYQEVRAVLRHRLLDPNERFPVRSRPNAIDPPPVPDTGCQLPSPCLNPAQRS